MDTIECGICFDYVLEKDLQYLNCFHNLCFKCFQRLVSLTCPFCRAEINLRSDILRNTDDDDLFRSFDYINFNYDIDSNSNIIFENDFTISGTSRKNRHENKRKRITKKKENLNSIVNEITLNTRAESVLIPNSKIRSSRKSRNETQIFFNNSI
jgi:hypothetical protein